MNSGSRPTTRVFTSNRPLAVSSYSRITLYGEERKGENEVTVEYGRNVPVHSFKCPDADQDWVCAAHRMETPWSVLL